MPKELLERIIDQSRVRDTSAATVQVAPPSGSTSDHGALTGLADNDHTQYLLRTEIVTEGGPGNADSPGQLDSAGVWPLSMFGGDTGNVVIGSVTLQIVNGLIVAILTSAKATTTMSTMSTMGMSISVQDSSVYEEAIGV
jgi:hypothetical protein